MGTLPNEVLRNILQYLWMDDLLAVSYTSKLLHDTANRFLYRDISDHNNCLVKCLQLNPSNTQYIRGLSSYRAGQLQWLWSNPLTLHRLEIFRDYLYSSTRNQYTQCLAAKNPDLWVEHLRFELDTTNDSLYLLQRLDTFKGLKELHIKIEGWAVQDYTLAFILPFLDSLQIERLEISNSLDCGAKLGNKLPNLVSINIDSRQVEDQMDGPTDELWYTLSALMERSIFYRVGPYREARSFHHHVMQYASDHHLDPAPLIQWLTACIYHFDNLDPWSYDIFHVDLLEFTSTDHLHHAFTNNSVYELQFC